MKTEDLLKTLKEGDSYYIAIRRPLAPKGTGAVVRFGEYLGFAPNRYGKRKTFYFRFVDHEFTGFLNPECIVRIGKTPNMDEAGVTR